MKKKKFSKSYENQKIIRISQTLSYTQAQQHTHTFFFFELFIEPFQFYSKAHSFHILVGDEISKDNYFTKIKKKTDQSIKEVNGMRK